MYFKKAYQKPIHEIDKHCPDEVESFDALCHWVRTHAGWSKKRVVKKMYELQ